MNKAVLKSNLNLNNVTDKYIGKVRDVYNLKNKYLVMLVSDRISAFDKVLPRAIPYKGQVLNQIAEIFLDATSDIVKNWKISCPDTMVTVGKYCKPFPIEMIVRGYLTGSSWRTYKKGARQICGVSIPEGMKEHQKFDKAILTPTTKAVDGHDEDITRDEIINSGLVLEKDYVMLEKYSLELFKRGTDMAAKKGLILVDTKYEFGKIDDEIFLIDEIHTPDSSRYFYADGYKERFDNNEQQKQLSKEFVREWLMENGFQGKEGQEIPNMSDEFVNSVSERYIELFEKITGNKFIKADSKDIESRVQSNVSEFLNKIIS